MKVLIYSSHEFEKEPFRLANRNDFDLHFLEAGLSAQTAPLAKGFPVVCLFANDRADAAAIQGLADAGVKLLALRSAGFNHVDLAAAAKNGIRVVRVPAYSPFSVAEHAVAMLLSLNRKIHRAFNRVREGNFSLDGLVGFDLHGKTVGIVGAGKIGRAFARIMRGFGCRLLIYDVKKDTEFANEVGAQFVSLGKLCSESDVISLHIPLTKETRHLLGNKEFSLFKSNAILINTGRGALIDTQSLVEKLKSGAIGGACLDVYEEEENLYFQDHSGEVLQDDLLARLLTFPNVLVTAHQGFLTKEALANIAATTMQSIFQFSQNENLTSEVTPA